MPDAFLRRVLALREAEQEERLRSVSLDELELRVCKKCKRKVRRANEHSMCPRCEPRKKKK